MLSLLLAVLQPGEEPGRKVLLLLKELFPFLLAEKKKKTQASLSAVNIKLMGRVPSKEPALLSAEFQWRLSPKIGTKKRI